MPVDPALQVKVDQVRDHVGSEPDDIAVGDALARCEDSPLRAALSILRRRRSDLIESPGKLSVDQDYSREITKVQLDALDAQIAEVVRLIDAEDGVIGDDDTSLTPVTTAFLSSCDGDRDDGDDPLMAEFGGPIVVRW